MRSLIIILLCISLPAFARLNSCNFSSDFAEKYDEARRIFAARLGASRATTPIGDRNAGILRRRVHGGNWQSSSLEAQIRRHFGNDNVKIQVNGNGKMIIHPDPMTNGRPVILFDVSGDYFRVADGKISSRGVDVGTKYYLSNGQPLGPTPNGMSTRQWLDRNVETTHFLAAP